MKKAPIGTAMKTQTLFYALIQTDKIKARLFIPRFLIISICICFCFLSNYVFKELKSSIWDSTVIRDKTAPNNKPGKNT